jgi:hypothetical protein
LSIEAKNTERKAASASRQRTQSGKQLQVNLRWQFRPSLKSLCNEKKWCHRPKIISFNFCSPLIYNLEITTWRQEQVDPDIPPGTGFPFVASYDSQGYGGGILTRLHTGQPMFRFRLRLVCDRRSVDQSVLVSGPHLGPMTRFFYYCRKFAVFTLWSALPDERTGL